MPHIIIDYSANLTDKVDMSALCETLRKTASGLDSFPMPGLRVRAHCAEHSTVADGNPGHGFIDITVRLREGRPVDVKKAAAETIFNSARNFLAPVIATNSLALSLEMRDIDAALSHKTGSIRDHL